MEVNCLNLSLLIFSIIFVLVLFKRCNLTCSVNTVDKFNTLSSSLSPPRISDNICKGQCGPSCTGVCLYSDTGCFCLPV